MRMLVGLLLAGAVLLPAAEYTGGRGKTGPPVAAAWTSDRVQQQTTVGDIPPGVPVNGVLEESDAR